MKNRLSEGTPHIEEVVDLAAAVHQALAQLESEPR
jgi:hypothetical protein